MRGVARVFHRLPTAALQARGTASVDRQWKTLHRSSKPPASPPEAHQSWAGPRRFEADFGGGALTSNGGALLLHAAGRTATPPKGTRPATLVGPNTFRLASTPFQVRL